MGGPRLVPFHPTTTFKRGNCGDKLMELIARSPADAKHIEGLIDLALWRLDTEGEPPSDGRFAGARFGKRR